MSNKFYVATTVTWRNGEWVNPSRIYFKNEEQAEAYCEYRNNENKLYWYRQKTDYMEMGFNEDSDRAADWISMLKKQQEKIDSLKKVYLVWGENEQNNRLIRIFTNLEAAGKYIGETCDNNSRYTYRIEERVMY